MNLLPLTFLFPLVGFLLLSFSRGRWSENLSALVGVGSVGLSALSAAWAIFSFHSSPPEGGTYSLVLWQWMAAGDFSTNFTLYLDGLSVTMLGVVTGVGFLIHLFASTTAIATTVTRRSRHSSSPASATCSWLSACSSCSSSSAP